MINRFFILFFTLLLFLPFPVTSQEYKTISRIRVEGGGRVPFQINSIRSYEQGTEYRRWTQLGIVFLDSILGTPNYVSPVTWNLTVSTDTPTMEGNFFQELDLKYLEVMIESPDAAINTIPGYGQWISPTHSGVPLLSGVPQGRYTLYVHYRLRALIGQPPDYYAVNLFFDITK
jgi:hypothetical protein